MASDLEDSVVELSRLIIREHFHSLFTSSSSSSSSSRLQQPFTTRTLRLGLQLSDSSLCHSGSYINAWQHQLTQAWLTLIRSPSLGMNAHMESLSAMSDSALADLLQIEVVVIPTDAQQSPCCVDEIGAQHLAVDWIVQGAVSCLTPAAKLATVVWTYPQHQCNGDHSVNRNHELFIRSLLQAAVEENGEAHHAINKTKGLVVLADAAWSLDLPQAKTQEIVSDYYPHATLVIPQMPVAWIPCKKQTIWAGQEIHNESEFISEGRVSEVVTDSRAGVNHNKMICGRLMQMPIGWSDGDFVYVYVGSEGKDLSNILLQLSDSTVFSFDPSSKAFRLEGLEVNKSLRRRYFLTEKAKDADVVGILVNNLAISNYLQIVERLKHIIKKSGKKYYTFVINKINPAKLANFMEIDLYVIVACPFNSLLDTKDFYRPVITPFELELALSDTRQWSGKIDVDFAQILALAEDEERESRNPNTEVLENIIHFE
eukprot:TRINITY_DN3952_c0_g2_i2.p1 TRINITY_DN3952_c0_g2~~TRINITY_DN3952_c0_g2_i2.p1  ORF type:complete len:485 (+),score=108.86 TRINITY_DN3952_c0_g2_i2:42-1496(+)